MSPKFFATRFAQTEPNPAEKYERYVIPTAGKVYWDGVINPMLIDWARQDRAPLLLIGGGKDLIADASMTEAIYRKQKLAKTVTELKIFDDRSHWTLMDKGWEAVADLALNWAVEHATDKRPVLRLAA